VHPGDIAQLADTARFLPNDPDSLVAASLACPTCLRSNTVERTLDLDYYDPSVECLCEHCGEVWRVFLAPQQALRMGLSSAPALV
jgi:hypothetical protein